MINNKALTDILSSLRQQHLSEALDGLENYLLMNNPSDLDRLTAVRDDYQLMTDYWKRGYQDPMRSQLYRKQIKRIYMLVVRQGWREQLKAAPYLRDSYSRARAYRNDWSAEAVGHDMEDFVSSVAMLELEPEHLRKAKSEKLYQEHQLLMSHLFMILLAEGPWTEGEAATYQRLLLSPTVDQNDQQLIVSALMLSCIQIFDYRKFSVLFAVYQQAQYEELRQRALVGWVLALDKTILPVYPEVKDSVTELCRDEQCRTELTELQMQLVYCLGTEEDQKVISQEIIPDLVKNSNIEMTPHGLIEKEDDALEEILHPDISERKMEQLEQSVNRMADMQKKGTDIYFGGFAQMKRFSFFNDMSNWFVPYHSNHPSVRQILDKVKGRHFLDVITRYGAFCDSDKYSFVMAFEQVLNHLPANILKMVEDGEAVPMPVGGELSNEEQQSAAFKRRIYLQDIYRFYRLFPVRQLFCDVFERESGPYLFFDNEIFSGTDLQQNFIQVARFLVKRKMKDLASRVFKNGTGLPEDYDYFMTLGAINDHNGVAVICYREAYRQKPDSEKAAACYARKLFDGEDFEKALEIFGQLLISHPDSKRYQLNHVVCLLKLNRSEEALPSLYKLSYLNPDDLQVGRVLAWAQSLTGKYEAAEKFYRELVDDAERCQPDDILNYGFCMWLKRDVDAAVALFARYFTDSKKTADYVSRTLSSEKTVLEAHGIEATDISMMTDCILNA